MNKRRHRRLTRLRVRRARLSRRHTKNTADGKAASALARLHDEPRPQEFLAAGLVALLFEIGVQAASLQSLSGGSNDSAMTIAQALGPSLLTTTIFALFWHSVARVLIPRSGDPKRTHTRLIRLTRTTWVLGFGSSLIAFSIRFPPHELVGNLIYTHQTTTLCLLVGGLTAPAALSIFAFSALTAGERASARAEITSLKLEVLDHEISSLSATSEAASSNPRPTQSVSQPVIKNARTQVPAAEEVPEPTKSSPPTPTPTPEEHDPSSPIQYKLRPGEWVTKEPTKGSTVVSQLGNGKVLCAAARTHNQPIPKPNPGDRELGSCDCRESKRQCPDDGKDLRRIGQLNSGGRVVTGRTCPRIKPNGRFVCKSVTALPEGVTVVGRMDDSPEVIYSCGPVSEASPSKESP